MPQTLPLLWTAVRVHAVGHVVATRCSCGHPSRVRQINTSPELNCQGPACELSGDCDGIPRALSKRHDFSGKQHLPPLRPTCTLMSFIFWVGVNLAVRCHQMPRLPQRGSVREADAEARRTHARVTPHHAGDRLTGPMRVGVSLHQARGATGQSDSRSAGPEAAKFTPLPDWHGPRAHFC